jgi:alanine-glyoxylate transaminase/serine-glyoxylate transaminase/serine-pyruvate transaminase
MNRALIDHRGPEFAELGRRVLKGVRPVFKTESPVLIFPSSGSGAWEAALQNTLSPGDRVLSIDQGFFAGKWAEVGRRLGLEVLEIETDWRRPVDPSAVEGALSADSGGTAAAVLVVHNETSTGVTSDIGAIRAAIDRCGHPALLMVDAVSSLGATDYRHDEWGVDVTVSGSQKGLMLPPGLGFTAVSGKALDAHERARLPRAYWDWSDMLRFNEEGFFPYTPATGLLYGLEEALAMLREEGLDRVFARHARFAEATRRAVAAWGLENYSIDPGAHSNSGTTVLMPRGAGADELRREILERFDMSLGTGLGRLKGSVFRIGHLGDLNELTLAGALCGVEMGLAAAGVPHTKGGVDAAMEFLVAVSAAAPTPADGS